MKLAESNVQRGVRLLFSEFNGTARKTAAEMFSIFSVLAIFFVGCQKNQLLVENVYRVPGSPQAAFSVWIVDGAIVRREIYPEFLYGGNDQRYLFIPKSEIWIDNAIAAEEFKYTLAHELKEQSLMEQHRLSYADAHDSALVVERQLRIGDHEAASAHERSLSKVEPRDCDGLKELSSISDSISLQNIYREFLGRRDSIDIWIVDGAAVRRDIFPDFGLSGNDLAYRFIPHREIWVDGEISCEETEFSIAGELHERMLMRNGDRKSVV
jgi:hypothetical protein